MFADDIRRALPATPRGQLAELAAAVWKGFACGALAEGEAQQLAEEIAARKAVPVCAPQNGGAQKRRVGSRPRSSEAMERRRRWTGSGWLPPQLAARFTMGETAVLAVVAAEVAKAGRCALSLDHIAALAGVGRSTAKTAIGEARALGVLSVEHRPVRPFRHRPNIIRITSPEWQSWISMRRSSQGVRTSTATSTHIHSRKKGRSKETPTLSTTAQNPVGSQYHRCPALDDARNRRSGLEGSSR